MTIGSPDHERLREVIEDLTGYHVILDHLPEEDTVLEPAGKIYIDVKAGATLGVDDFYKEYDEDLDVIRVVQTGNRLFTLSVKMESYDSRVHAHEVLETLRILLQRQKNLARLREKGMTVAFSEPIADLPTIYDNRVLSVSVLDLKMALRFSEETTDWAQLPGETDADYLIRVRLLALESGESDYIDTLDVEGTLEDDNP